MRTAFYFLALIPAIIAAPAASEPVFEDNQFGIEAYHNATDITDGRPSFFIETDGDLEEVRQNVFLNIVANLTTSLLDSADQLAEISGKSLEDVVQLPDSQPLGLQKRDDEARPAAERKATWQEITYGIIDVAEITLRGMQQLWNCVDALEMAEVAYAIESVL